jgi:hypothetical protein
MAAQPKRPKFSGRQAFIRVEAGYQIDGYKILQIPKIGEEIRRRLEEGLKRSYGGAHSRGNPSGRRILSIKPLWKF